MTDTLIAPPKVIINLQEQPPEVIELIEALVGKPGPVGPKGDRGFTWKGVYSSATAYSIDHVVFYNNVSYICILGCTNILPTNATYWEVFPLLNEVTLDALNAGLMDNRYYTESEVNGLLNTKAPTDHDHLKTDITDFAHTHVKADVGLGNVDNTTDLLKPISTAQATVNGLKVDKLMATNLVTNGDFSNGTTGWTATQVSGFQSVDGIAEFTANQQYGGIYRFYSGVVNEKVYVCVKMKSTSSNVIFYLRKDGSPYNNLVAKAHSGSNQFELLSGIGTFTATSSDWLLNIRDIRTTGFDKVFFDNFILLNLTTIFGAGKEPTKEQMDRLLSIYPNSWFDGTKEIINVKQMFEEKVDRLMATNLITNGDFSNGTTGWTTIGGTLVNGELSFDTSVGILLKQDIQTIANRKYYVSLYAYHNGTSGGWVIRNYGTVPVSNNLTFTLSNVKTRYSGVLINTSDGTFLDIVRSGVGGIQQIDNILMIDLTAIFGAGKEPSALEMDNLLANFPNSHFNGTQELINYRQLYLAKANIAQEAWITPTLLNSWAEFDTGVYSKVKYFKDTLGRVHLHGLLKTGIANATAFRLPVGYRPLTGDVIYFTTRNNVTTLIPGFVTADGFVTPTTISYTGYVIITGVNFYAEG